MNSCFSENSTPATLSANFLDKIQFRRMWSQLFDNLEDFVLILGKDRTVIFANRSALRFLNFNRAEVYGVNFASLAQTLDFDCTEGGHFRMQLLPKGKAPVEVDASIAAAKADGELITLVVIRPTRAYTKIIQALKAAVKRLALNNRSLSEQVETDVLTGLLNRRGVQRILRREASLSKRGARTLSCAVVDLDNFKLINDRYGHAVGDNMLQAVAERLVASVRKSDYLARIGGDEFLILMPSTDLPAALKVMERCTQNMSGSPLLFNPEPVCMTISSALCALQNDFTLAGILEQTTFALKSGKSLGKNRVVCTQPALDFESLMPRVKLLTGHATDDTLSSQQSSDGIMRQETAI